jgi:hypothetical protein
LAQLDASKAKLLAAISKLGGVAGAGAGGGGGAGGKQLAKVLFDYEANSKTELTVATGDVVTILNTDNEEWWEAELKGKVGFFPKTYCELLKDTAAKGAEVAKKASGRPSDERRAEVLFTYDARSESELTIKVGTTVKILSTSDEEWWQGERDDGEVGYFPATYVKLLKAGTGPASATSKKATLKKKSDKAQEKPTSSPAAAPSAAGAVKSSSPTASSSDKDRASAAAAVDDKKKKKTKKKYPQAKVKHDYDADGDNELSIKQGWIIDIIAKTNDDWWEGRYKGKIGFFPKDYVELLAEKASSAKDADEDDAVLARVMFDYDASGPTEMTIATGQIVTIVDKTNDDWWEGEYNGKSGFFPKAYVELIDETDKKGAKEAKDAKDASDKKRAKDKKDKDDAAGTDAVAAAAAAKKKADEEAAAKKIADDEAAAAKKKADEVAAAEKKKADDAAVAAKKEADDAAAAAKKKADEAAAAAKKKADDEAAAAKKKAEEAAAALEAQRLEERKKMDAAARKKADEEEAARKKKADEEAAVAKKKAEEEAAAAKKKADDDALAAKKKADEDALAAKKKADDDALAAKKKADEAAAAAKKKADDDAAAAAAKKKAADEASSKAAAVVTAAASSAGSGAPPARGSQHQPVAGAAAAPKPEAPRGRPLPTPNAAPPVKGYFANEAIRLEARLKSAVRDFVNDTVNERLEELETRNAELEEELRFLRAHQQGGGADSTSAAAAGSSSSQPLSAAAAGAALLRKGSAARPTAPSSRPPLAADVEADVALAVRAEIVVFKSRLDECSKALASLPATRTPATLTADERKRVDDASQLLNRVRREQPALLAYAKQQLEINRQNVSDIDTHMAKHIASVFELAKKFNPQIDTDQFKQKEQFTEKKRFWEQIAEKGTSDLPQFTY